MKALIQTEDGLAYEDGVPDVDLRVWHGEGHLVSVTHDREIVQELISRR